MIATRTKLLKISVIGCLALAMLWGCGSGGGGSQSNNSNPPPGPVGPTLTFQPDSSGGSPDHVLALALNSAESRTDLAVLDLVGTNLDTVDASGISADLQFDSTWMSFMGFEIDSGSIRVELATPLEVDPKTLVIGVHGLKVQNGHLGKIKFHLAGTGQSAQLAFTSLTYIDSNSNLLSNPAMTGRGGTLQIQN